MPVEYSFPLVILAIVLIVWFVVSHADVRDKNRDEHHTECDQGPGDRFNFGRKMMNKTIIYLAVLLIGACLMFVGIALEIGVSHRHPTTVTLAPNACGLLPSNIEKSPVADGMCRIEAGDFRLNGKLVEIWFASAPNEAFSGQDVTLPADAVRVAIGKPPRPSPLWVKLLVYVGMSVLLGAMVAVGLMIRGKSQKTRE